MKADILPNLEDVELLDRMEQAATIRVSLYDNHGHKMVFMAEHNRHGQQAIAANSLTYIQQLLDKFELQASDCEFYRYVYSPASGPILGRFSLKLSGEKPVSYSMKMLSQIELDHVSKLLEVIPQGELRQAV
ncbi:MAG: hypothetical protein OIF51_05765 [Cellvibrionaceae bacterium]|nr:hypothetical protein [Cellvibrionaceae bacterium]